MKKIITTCFYLILTSAVIASVFFLPSALFTYEDQKLFAKVDQTEIESMEFTYSYSLIDTLNLLSSGYYTVEYPASGSTRTADEICKIASDALMRLNNFGKEKGIPFIGSGDSIIDYNTGLELAISENYDTGISDPDRQPADSHVSADSTSDTGVTVADLSEPDTAAARTAGITSAVIWRCHLYSDYGYLAEFRIDDKSGKVVGFFLWNNPKKSVTSVWPADTMSDILHEFLQDYYGLPTEFVLSDTKRIGTDYPVTGYGGQQYTTKETSVYRTTFHIKLTDEFGNSARLILNIYPDSLALN